MATIAENLQIIKDSTEAIRRVILEKGGTISGGISTYADSISNIGGGGGSGSTGGESGSTGGESGSTGGAVSKSDVNFYDYDGTLLYSYVKGEFLSLSQLPELPTRDGLICQGWNYDIDSAKEYVEEYGVLDVVATYITSDGKTRLYISINGRMNVPLYFSQTVSNGVTIDWGDGSEIQTISGTGNINTTHTYTDIGEYTISLSPENGCILGLGTNSSSYCVLGSTEIKERVYGNMLQSVEIGRNVTSIGGYAFYYCYSLSSIAIPNSVTSIGSYTFYYCYSLSSVVIPNSVTSIGERSFAYCYSLSSIVIPNSVTSIGSYTFYNCCSLSSVVIPNSVTSIGERSFQNCYSLSSIVIPNSVISISNYAFYSCCPLSSVVIPNSVTSIGSSAFYNCYSLSSVVVSNGVTSIGSSAFYNCYGVAHYDFSQCATIPTLSSTNAFTNLPRDCKIIVPDSLYDSWRAATNWSTYTSIIIKKSDWDAQNN